MTDQSDEVPALARNTLLRKRSDIAGKITNLQRQLADLRADLLHLDYTLRILEPDYEPQKTFPRVRARFSTVGYFEHGELTRRIYDGLRRAQTITAAELADAAVADKKLTDQRARNYFVSRFLSRLAGMAKAGKLIRVRDGFSVSWRLSDSPH